MIRLLKQYKVILLIILLIFVNFLYIFLGNNLNGFTRTTDETMSIATEKEGNMQSPTPSAISVEATLSPKEIPVFLCGAVERPGVYYRREGTIINDLITAAGGFLKEADQVAVNLAAPIKANEKIYVPKVGEKIDKTLVSYENKEGIESKGTESIININTAKENVLEALPGVGKVRAEEIIRYREKNGGFKKIEEIKNVSGIGEKTYEKLKSEITVE